MKSTIPHNKRKSFKKWAMPNQRVMTKGKQLIEMQRAKSMHAGRNYTLVGRNGHIESRPQASGLFAPIAFVGLQPCHDRLMPRTANRGVKSYSIRVASKGLVYSSIQNVEDFR